MKRTIRMTALLLLLILLGTLCACGDKHTEADINTMEGTYRLVDAAGEGSKDILKIKDGFKLEVRADNTATLSLMTDTHELIFDPVNQICISTDEEQVPYTFDGRQIVMDSKPFRMVFERQ